MLKKHPLDRAAGGSQTRGMSDVPLLSVQNLACHRGGRQVFAGISFEIRAGNALSVEGPNGAGKSSLLRVLAGLGAASGGTVAPGCRTSYLGHHLALKRMLTVRENLGYAAGLTGHRSDARTVTALGLEPLLDVPVQMLSQGQQRRVALARAFEAASPLWLLDEPTVGLDAATVAAVGTMLCAHLAAGGAVIAATHLDLGMPGCMRLVLGT